MIKTVLNAQTKSITLSSLILGVANLASAALGLFRDRLLASNFGAGDTLDIYYAAFRIPDFVAMVFIMGAISAAIIPVFSEYLVKEKEEAWKFTSSLLSLFFTLFAFVSFFLIVFTPQLMSLIAPGFKGEKMELTILLTRIMFLSPIILGISNIFSGILQVFHRFLVTALAPVLYNVGIILGIVFFVPKMGIQGLAWGVVLGGILHLLIQLPVMFASGFNFKKAPILKHAGVRKVIKLMVPRSLGLAATQINLIIITAIASSLASGSITIFNFANNLTAFVLGLVAIPFSTAFFPVLSMAYANQDKEKFLSTFTSVIRQTIFLVIPLSILLFVLRAQVVRVVLGVGHFGWLDTKLTAACLGLFSLGILAQGLSLLISKTFFALHDTKTPAVISLFTVINTFIMGSFFVWLLKFPNIFSDFMQNILKLQNIKDIAVIGLPLSFSIAVAVQCILLIYFLKRKVNDLKLEDIITSLIKTLTASAVMVIVTYLGLHFMAGIVDMQTFLGVFLQAAISGIIGLGIYVLAAFLLRSPEIEAIKVLVFRLLKY